MRYGYARVSTRGQATDGNSLEAQEAALKAAGAEVIYREAFTGTKKHRPELDKLMSILQDGETLVVTKLDRMARSALHGIDLISGMLDRGVRINVLNLGVMDNTPSGKLTRTIFFAFAEFERDMIVERTSEGKAIAKLRPGYREGRNPIEIPGLEEFREKQKDGTMTVSEICRQLGISRTTWYDRVKEVA